MKIFKKIVLVLLSVLVISIIVGYFYFDQKFTPEKNYLNLQNESGKIPIKWLGNDKNILLLPIHFPQDSTLYYMQFDTGSPSTIFYANSIKQIKAINEKNDRAKSTFTIGNTKISSDKFMIVDNVQDDPEPVKIIGTIGADILEDKKTLINFRENYVIFNLSKELPDFKNNLTDFKFKKRKIILYANLNGKEDKFLYDSGTSAYELLTNKEVWEDLKSPKSKVIIRKEHSWEKTLTSYTAQSKNSIIFSDSKIPLNEVTCVEGFSESQYLMMKFSGMTGMLGNKIFINNSIYIDCTKNKIGIQ
jgi:hypothetical protein